MAKFVAAPDVEQKALRLVERPLARIAEQVEKVAKELAPPTKTWISMRDGGVRRQHVMVDGDEVPDNLRFTLTAYEWDVQHPGRIGPLSTRTGGGGGGWEGEGGRLVSGAHTYLRFPRDVTGGAYIAIVNCRCHIDVDPDGIAKLISTEAPVLSANTLTITVVCEGDWVREAEYGTTYPGDLVAEGTHFMGRAAAQVAAARRARR